MEAALFNWPLLITEGLCRPSPLLSACRRLAFGSICVYMDSRGVSSLLLFNCLCRHFQRNWFNIWTEPFFFFGKSLSRFPLPIKYLTLEVELAYPSCQLQTDGIFMYGCNYPYHTFHGHFIECVKARSNCSKIQKKTL